MTTYHRQGGHRNRRPVVLGPAPLLAGTPLLLTRMRRDLDQGGRLRTSTAAWMWTAYASHAALTAAALIPAPPRHDCGQRSGRPR